MAGAKSIEGLSIVFTLGVIAGTYVSAWPMWATPLLLVTLVLWARREASTPLLLLTFLTLGVFVASTVVPFPDRESLLERLALDSAEKLKALIRSIPFPTIGTASLLTALLTGDRSGLSREVIQAFRGSGASHILALSGLHMGILYVLFDKLTLPLGKSPSARKIRAALIVCAAGWFTLATGASPSIVRAFLFICIGEFCNLTGRSKKLSRVLCVALLIQLTANPAVIKSLGFQLSYLAMAGIALLYPTLEKLYPEGSRFNPLRKIWQMAALSISCQVFTAPLVWQKFGTLPRHFLLTNLMAIPIVTILMGFAVATVLLSSLGLCPQLLITITDGLSRLLVWVLEIISA